MKQHNGRIGNLPANINLMNPVPNKDAKSVVRLLRTNGKVSGYELSDGTRLTKSQGVALAKQGGIRGWPSPAATAASTCAPCPTATPPATWETCPAPPLPVGSDPPPVLPALWASFLRPTPWSRLAPFSE